MYLIKKHDMIQNNVWIYCKNVYWIIKRLRNGKYWWLISSWAYKMCIFKQ